MPPKRAARRTRKMTRFSDDGTPPREIEVSVTESSDDSETPPPSPPPGGGKGKGKGKGKEPEEVPTPLTGDGHAQRPNPLLSNPPPKAAKPTIPRSLFAGSYRSRLTELSATHAPSILPLLTHVNCSFLSGPTIPTLEQLKQHAQALTILIREISISTTGGFIDNANITVLDDDGNQVTVPTFSRGETFDWLNDLQRGYVNHDEHHRLPLSGVANCVDLYEEEDLDFGVNMDGVDGMGAGTGHAHAHHEHHEHRMWRERDKCPLFGSGVTPSEPGMPSLPFATHQNLISHANEVLELLDHEYSGMGGLLAILPPKENRQQRALAETTLLGQMIDWIQSLVLRVHTLERQYANATDIIHGESTVPAQTLEALGVSGRQPRLMTYPQDRFVLANCGDDVWSHLDDQLHKQAMADENQRVEERFHGVANQDGREHYDDLVFIDVYTRYYRLTNQKEKTILICPAHEIHPGVKVTREMEKTPSVVTVVKPVHPERASDWLTKHKETLHQAKLDRAEVIQSRDRIENLKDTITTYDNDNKLHRARNHHLLTTLESFTSPEHNNDDYHVHQTAMLNMRSDDLDTREAKINQELDALAAQRQLLRDSTQAIEDERAQLRARDAQAALDRTEKMARLEREADVREAARVKKYDDEYNHMVTQIMKSLEAAGPVVDEIKNLTKTKPWTEQQAKDFCDRVYNIAVDVASGKYTVTPRTTKKMPGEGVILTKKPDGDGADPGDSDTRMSDIHSSDGSDS